MNRFRANIARHAAIIIACATIVACGSHKNIEKGKTTQPATTQKPTSKPQPKIEEKPVRPPFVQKHFTTTSGTKWGDIDYDDEPWVSNTSRPIEITRGLKNRHFAIWQSHGRYYDLDIDKVWDMIDRYFAHVKASGYFDEKRHEQERYWMRETINEQLLARFYFDPEIERLLSIKEDTVLSGKQTSFVAASDVLNFYYDKITKHQLSK